MNVAFTGHRDFPQRRFAEQLTELLETIVSRADGSVTFWCGMAVGFDMAAAEVVLALKSRWLFVELVAVVPFPEQTQFYDLQDKLLYERILSHSDRVVLIDNEYQRDIYYRRNVFLVQSADMVVAYYDGGSSGGTAYTIRQAKKAKLPIENLYPQQQLSLF